MLKEILRERKVQIVLLLLVLAIWRAFLFDWNPQTVDLNFGIEFVGGVRIPISLEKGVDSVTMSSMVDTIKTRINKFGLSQSVVRPLGDKEIIVEIPRADQSVIKSVEKILREQGRFEAIIDGKIALTGRDLMSGGVGGAQGERITQEENEEVRWELDFAVTRQGADQFAKASYGKANYPVYLFLDRPENAFILLDKDELGSGNLLFAEKLLKEALKKEGDDILLYYVQDWNEKRNEIASLNKSTALVSESLKEKRPEVFKELQEMGYLIDSENSLKKMKVFAKEDFIPVFVNSPTGASITTWKAIGLLSAPVLSPDLAKGTASQFYAINGMAAGKNLQEKKANALRELKELKSILSGGKLPVATVVGSSYVVAPSLGEKFLSYSWIALLVSITFVSFIIIARYKKLILVFPIVFVNSVEILVTTAIIGGIGTLDLSAMAGIIAMMGTGVNDQLIITDEVLKKKGYEQVRTKEKISRAFYIIFTVAGVSTAAMFPLLMSGIVEVMGFALSTIIGLFVGVLFTRPAFGVILRKIFGE